MKDGEFVTPARSLYEMRESEEQELGMGTPARSLYSLRESSSFAEAQMASPFTPCRITLAQVLLQMRTHSVPPNNVGM